MEKDLKDLLIDELRDIVSSEDQIVEALPKMVIASESTDLKQAFQSHLKETKGQIQRLKKIFKILKIEQKEKFCKATKGLIQECEDVLKDFKLKSPTRDAALISKAQRIEHYEISVYGTARTFAKELGLSEIAGLLQETLDEEGNANKKLSKLAEGGLLTSGINHYANIPSETTESDDTRKKSSPKKSSAQAPAKKQVATPAKKTGVSHAKKAVVSHAKKAVSDVKKTVDKATKTVIKKPTASKLKKK